MTLTRVFNINKDIIYVKKNKNVEFFSQNLVYKPLKAYQYIRKFKKYYLVLNIAVSSPLNCF